MLYFSKLKVSITLIVIILSCIITVITNFCNNKLTNGIKLGLDLKGGSYILLEPDLNVLRADIYKNLKDIVLKTLGNKNISYTNFITTNDGFCLNIENYKDFLCFKESLIKSNNNLKIIRENNKVFITIKENTYSLTTKDILNQSIEIIRRRIDELGTREPLIKIMGKGIVVELPGVDNPQQIKDIIGKMARISFNMVDSGATFNNLPIPLGYRYVYSSNDNIRYAISVDDILTGKHLKKATLSFNENNQPVVSFVLDSYGSKNFAKTTSENIGKLMAIVLDNKVISAPVINSPILGGSGVIEGKFTLNEAQNLALLLQAGSLPVPLSITEENTIGPTLGADSIKAGLYSSIFGLFLVFIYMVIFYRKLGLIANFSLITNIILTFAILSLFEATLTLPGVAGIILGIGMAVDSNILVYERYNFEIQYAKPALAMTNSFNKVYQTLIDSNLTTLFASIFLFYFGSGPIRGFAVTLMIAILASMFSIFFTTRMLVNWFYLRGLKQIKKVY